jgi:DNA-binding response OmpR family regulator
MRGKIIIIDDDTRFLNSISVYLSGRGFEVLSSNKWNLEVKQELLNNDVFLLDINLPKISGFEVLQYIHKHAPTLKVILMTGDDSLIRRLKGFSLGADDYMKKPLYPAEVAARIDRYCAIKYQKSTTETLPCDQSLLERLTQKELALFSTLLKTPNTVLSTSALTEATGTATTLYTTLFRLKKKLVNSPYRIVSAYGRGWKLASKLDT